RRTGRSPASGRGARGRARVRERARRPSPWPAAPSPRRRAARSRAGPRASRSAGTRGPCRAAPRRRRSRRARRCSDARARPPPAPAPGRVLAEEVRARIDLPPFDSSAMDGFAVRAADTPGRLTVVGHSAAGSPETRELGAGEAIVISTGAVVPAGADAVVPVERTTGDVEVERVVPGDTVRP